MPDCSKLRVLDDFGHYVDAIVQETQFQRDRMESCKLEICSAIYGTGNPDISGIGVAIGYGIETGLGVVLSAAALLLSAKRTTALRIVWTGLRSFYCAAAYFAIAIQLATIAVLVQKDYGISTSNFEAIESQIAQAISVICLLPLVYPLSALCSTDGNTNHNLRLFLLNVGVALSVYPFLSRCIHSFDRPPLRDSKGVKVSLVNWGEVESMCFNDGMDRVRSSGLYQSVGVLELVAMLIVYLFTFWHLLGLLSPHLRARESWWYRAIFQRDRWHGWPGGYYPIPSTICLLVPLAFAVPLLWVIFFLRDLQEELAKSTFTGYEGNNWGFGQVVSIVIFAPVAVDMFYEASFNSD